MIPAITYQAHCQSIGWQNPITEGIAGTTGKSLRLEVLRIHLIHAGDASLSFDVHIQGDGWKFNLTENDLLGTTGKSKRMKAIVIRSYGLNEKGFKIQYKVYIQQIRWLPWVNEGEMAGTTGKCLRMEAIQIRIIPEFTAIPNITINNTFTLVKVQLAEQNNFGNLSE